MVRRLTRLLSVSGFQSGAFDDAVTGVDAIAHTASTVSFAADDPNGEFAGCLVTADIC